MTGTQGGSHEQHVKSGQQSHKNSDSEKASKGDGRGKSTDPESSTRGGLREQDAKAGEQNQKQK